MRDKRKKIFYLSLYVIVACCLVYIFKPVYLISILLVLLPPSVINFLWLKKSKIKIFVFSFVSAILFAPPVEIMARLTDAWDVQSVLPRLFGIAPAENIIFAFFNFFWIVCFYEYFVDGDRSKKISVRLKLLTGLYIVLAVVVFSLFFYNRSVIALNYHLLAVVVLLVPSLIIFGLKPKLLGKVWLPMIFFALVFFIYEAVSLLIGSWWWPGEYLWPINLFGHIFPLDDVLIWYILSTPTLIGGYEFFVDDGK